MKKLFGAAIVALALVCIGCKKEEPAAAPDLNAPGAQEPGAGKKSTSNLPAPPPTGTAPSGSGSSVNVTPIGGVGAGPMTPVAGTENIQGGGSSAGMVLKEKAKGVAAQSPSSVNQTGGDDN